MSSVLKLHYFPFAGRAEPTRLILTLGRVPFEDVFIDSSNPWPKAKASMPFGQVPVLELADGRRLAQSGAIERYAAKLAGLYPEDPWQAALADQAVFLVADAFDLLNPTYAMPLEEKVKTRRELLSGKLGERLVQLDGLVGALPAGGYIAGDKMSYADVAVFCALSNMTSGFLDGFPANLLEDYPALRAYHNRVAALPDVRAYYADRTDRASFKPTAVEP